MEPVQPLESAVNDYRQWVSTLVKEADVWPEEAVLATLHSRDRTQYLIDQLGEMPETQTLPPQFWIDLANADAELGRQSDRLYALPDLASWRKSVHPPEHHWWWYPPAPEVPKDALAWLWGGLTIAMLTISLALAQDIASRFTTDAPGVWSSLGAIAPVILTLFASGGALTNVGQQALERILASRTPAHTNWARIKFVLAFTLALGLFLFHSLGLPRIAAAYNQQGEEQFDAGDWAGAQNDFQQALSLKPDYPEAQFNLGVMYEEYQQYDQARTEYLKAMQGGYLPAYNNLAQLYLQQGDTDSAAPLLRQALSAPDLKQKGPELEYALHKNLGQVRLAQDRLPEAEAALREAIELGQSLETPRPDAYCLLGQVLDQQAALPNSPAYSGDSTVSTAQSAWNRCLQTASQPEHDYWESMARQALTQPQPPSAPN
ncbi:tetratricopeptide repeat protein [Leptolyngbya sp. CCNP1308]|uniref:tetratricopeptide repeat protein n=1 Tax=Leptolyngbya sp. CCNP1308 TaxID=3110255 RepID=UPI002B20FD1B|nr:tetratricopeptide repeat protein [Leptolyngbya sp. CCNP1308]MEA5448227.1 tetratricopeptide repeat protein [Leptolyngbya sp. CCNP1308]